MIITRFIISPAVLICNANQDSFLNKYGSSLFAPEMV